MRGRDVGLLKMTQYVTYRKDYKEIKQSKNKKTKQKQKQKQKHKNKNTHTF